MRWQRPNLVAFAVRPRRLGDSSMHCAGHHFSCARGGRCARHAPPDEMAKVSLRKVLAEASSNEDSSTRSDKQVPVLWRLHSTVTSNSHLLLSQYHRRLSRLPEGH